MHHRLTRCIDDRRRSSRCGRRSGNDYRRDWRGNDRGRRSWRGNDHRRNGRGNDRGRGNGCRLTNRTMFTRLGRLFRLDVAFQSISFGATTYAVALGLFDTG